MRDEFLTLRVWRFNNRLYSQNNRRLWALKEHQRRTPHRTIRVWIDEMAMPPEISKFFSSMTGGGRRVRVRRR